MIVISSIIEQLFSPLNINLLMRLLIPTFFGKKVCLLIRLKILVFQAIAPIIKCIKRTIFTTIAFRIGSAF
jgi:hypothetical protein